MKKLVSVFLLLSACSHQRIKQNRDPAEVSGSAAIQTISIVPELQNDVETLKRIFRQRIKVLDRDLVTFHYADMSHSNFSPRSSIDLQNRMSNGYFENYFDPLKFDPTMNGAGLYVAVDPFSSQDRAQKQPQLYVVTLAKGSLILNATEPYHGDERRILEDVYDRLDCGRGGYKNYNGDPSRDGGLPMIIHAIRESSVENCRRVLIRAVQDLGIHGFMDRYGNAPNLNECRADISSREILIVRHEAIRLEDLNYYDNQSKLEGTPISDYLVNLYTESVNNRTSSIPSSLKVVRPVPSDYSGWKRSRIFGCGSRRTVEE